MHWALAIGLTALLGACASQPSKALATRLRPLELALTVDLADLQRQAGGGSAQDQLALALIYSEGLRGQVVDPDLAASLASRALAQRGSTQVTTYTPAFGGQPSRVGLVQTPRYDLTEYDLMVVQHCIRALRADVPAPAAAPLCGGPAEYAKLSHMWRSARR